MRAPVTAIPALQDRPQRGRLLRVGGARMLAGLVTVVALVLQLWAPAAAQASDSTWVEICSEVGPVLIQMDLSDEPSDPGPCPKCQDCALCAVADGLSGNPMLKPVFAAHMAAVNPVCPSQSVAPNPAQFWPDNRGPPVATQYIIERALRASIASNPNIGGALWT